MEEQEEVGDGQRGQAHVGGGAHAVLHEHHQAEDVAHHPEDGGGGDEHHAEHEGHLVEGGLRHRLRRPRHRHRCGGVVADDVGVVVAAEVAAVPQPGGGGGVQEVGVVHDVGDVFVVHHKHHGWLPELSWLDGVAASAGIAFLPCVFLLWCARCGVC